MASKFDGNNFYEVNRSNARFVSLELAKRKGALLLYVPKMCDSYRHGSKSVREIWDGAEFRLYHNAQIIGSNELTAKVDLKRNREYSLRKRYPSKDPMWESAYDSFKGLKFGSGFVFEIHGLFTVGCGVFSEAGKTIYVPDKIGLQEQALRFAFGTFIHDFNNRNARQDQINPSCLDKIMPFVAGDLKTGKVLRHNIEAGQEADALFGM